MASQSSAMKIKTKNLRNVVLLGHAGSGKTTFVENMLFETEAINRLGSVGQESTTSDYTNIERAKKYSIFTSLMHVHWNCLLYTSPSPRDGLLSRMPSS